jgi:hypothetical protein
MLALQRRLRLTRWPANLSRGVCTNWGLVRSSRSCNSSEDLQPLAIHHRHEPESTLLKESFGGWSGSTAPEEGIRQKACCASSFINHKGIAQSDPTYSPNKLSKQGPGIFTVLSDNDRLVEGKTLADHAPHPQRPVPHLSNGPNAAGLGGGL